MIKPDVNLMRYLRYGLGILVLIGQSLVAVPVAAQSANPEALKPLLEELATTDRLQGRFRQEKTLAGLSAPLDSSGTFSFSRDNGLRWTVETPIPMVLLITPDRIVQQQDGTEEVLVDFKKEPLAVSVSQILLAVFAGDWQALDAYFELHPERDDPGWKLVLVPDNDQIAAFAGQITLRGNRYLRAVTLEEQNGDQTYIELHTVSDH